VAMEVRMVVHALSAASLASKRVRSGFKGN
jgi:hypothetical protein